MGTGQHLASALWGLAIVLATPSPHSVAIAQEFDQRTQNQIAARYRTASELYAQNRYADALAKIVELERMAGTTRLPTAQNLKIKILVAMERFADARAALDELYELQMSAAILGDVAEYEPRIDAGLEAERERLRRERAARAERDREERIRRERLAREERQRREERERIARAERQRVAAAERERLRLLHWTSATNHYEARPGDVRVYRSYLEEYPASAEAAEARRIVSREDAIFEQRKIDIAAANTTLETAFAALPQTYRATHINFPEDAELSFEPSFSISLEPNELNCHFRAVRKLTIRSLEGRVLRREEQTLSLASDAIDPAIRFDFRDGVELIAVYGAGNRSSPYLWQKSLFYFRDRSIDGGAQIEEEVRSMKLDFPADVLRRIDWTVVNDTLYSAMSSCRGSFAVMGNRPDF